MVERAGLMVPESRAAAMELGPQDAFGVALRDPSRASGLGALGATMADVQVAFDQVVNLPAPDYTTMRAPQAPAGPAVYFDQARNLFSVNGYAFDAEDYNSAVQSRALLDAEPAQPPAGGTWTRIGTGMFEQYLASIENPKLGTRFGRSFDIGVQNLKTLGGAGLQFLGAEETGAGVVNRASEELQRLSPFQVSAAEVASGELGAIEYAVSVLGQQGPNILESIGTALVGAAAGGVASGNPIGAAVGSFGALLSKSVIKGAAREAAEAYARGAASTAQKKLLARIGGAAAATAVNNYAIGVSDVYSETRRQGAGPENMDARAISAAIGVPYAVLSTIPEAIAAGRLFGFSNAAGGLLRRAGTGAGIGAGLEGVTEAGQEALVMAGGQQFGGDYTDEYLSRLIEAGVAGAVVGGGIGGVVNLRAGKPTDILQGRQEPPADAAPAPLGLPAPAPLGPPADAAPAPLGLPAPAPLGLPAPAPLGLPAPAAAPAGQQEMFTSPEMGIGAATQARLTGQQLVGAPRGLTQDTALLPPVPVAPTADPQLNLPLPISSAPPVTAPNQLQQQLMALQQRQQQAAAALAAERAAALAAERAAAPTEIAVEPTPTGEITPREYDAAYGGWEEVRADQSNPDVLPSLPRLNKKAQREWVMAVRAGTADAALFGRLVKRKVSKAEPLVATGVTATREADINAMQQQVATARATEAAQQDLQGMAAALRALGQRMERARPPLPANTYGTEAGAPFRNKAQANAPANRKRVAKQINQETGKAVTAKDLEPVEVAGGWALRVKTPPTPPAPKPTLKRGKPDAVREQGAKASTLRKGPKAGGEVRSSDTEGQTATGEGTQETAQEDTTQEQQPVREAEVAPPPAKPAKPKKVKLPAEQTATELDRSIAMGAVETAEGVITNDARKKRTLLTQAELDAGVELTVLSQNSDPEVAAAALDVLELNLSATQYKELAAYVERANNHGSLGGDRADADFAGKELQNMVTMFNSGAVPDSSVVAFEARFRGLVARVRKSDPKADVLGYATVNNSPNKKMGQIAHTTPNTNSGGAFSLASLADVVLGNGKRAVPLAIGKQRMIARNILNKFKVKPELSVFASQADMKQRNPALYKRAAAARSQGDFDSAPAVGYFFDNQVIIFSDRVATRQQLEFVVAHEVLGHFGMRSVLGASEFNTLMESFYTDSVPYMKIAVDDMVAARGIPRAEAVEEYLSDFAARVEMSILRRWWAKAKDALNNIGFKFDDDAARYLMNQSGRYLRTGEKGSVFNTDLIANTMHQLDAGTDPTGVGRFSTAAEHVTIRSIGHTVDDPGRVMPSSIQDALDKVTRAVEVLGFSPKDLADKWDSLKRNTVTPAVFRGMRNEGLQKVFDNMTRTTNIARSLVTRMQTMRDIALNPRAEKLAKLGMGGSGISVDGRAKAGYVLKANRMYHSHAYKMPSMRNLPKLFLRNPATGELQLQDGTLTKLLEGNRLSRGQWAAGVRVPYDTDIEMTDAKRAELAAERDAAVAAATTDRAKNRITRDYKARIENNTYTGVAYLDVKQEFTDLEWGAFNQELDSMGTTAVELLESILTKHGQERLNSYRRVAKALDAAMTDGDRALLDRVVRRYVEIQDANLTLFEGGQIDPSTRDTAAAEKFLVQFNAALLGTGRDRIYGLFAPNADNNDIVALPESERKELTDMIDGFLTRYNPPAADPNAVESLEKRRVVQREVGLIAGQLTTSHDAEKAAVRTIQTGYVPIVREGKFQANMVFTGADGKGYVLGESYREQAPYMQYKSRTDADRAAKELTTLFGDKEFTVEVWDPEAANGRGKLVMKKGNLSGVSSVTLDAPTTDPEISHDAALRFIRRFNIPLTPQKLEDIVKASTTSGNRAILRQLKTGFTPGAPNDLTSAISAHIESRAATIARNNTSVELDTLLDIRGESAELWTGSKKRYDTLKAEYERLKAAANPNDDAISVARQKFEQYHRWYVTENAPTDGNKFYAEARSMVAFRDQQKGVLETDLANNKHIAMVQMLTSVSYLGFMMASGALNVVSGFVNSPAALATTNHETGFGGGFGVYAAYAAMVRATKVAAGLGGQKDTAKYWQDLTPAQLQEMGISAEARDFVALGIDSGILQAAQTNSLMGSARGRITSGGAQKFLMVYMAPFNWTEQVGRRTTALASFELMFQRHLAAGKSRAEAAEAASAFSTQMVLTTLGGYTAIDRPALFRGGPLQFAFMFQMFTVNTAALTANLPRSGQVLLLGSLLLLSGLRGVPYAEDIEDLVNTLAQKFGIPMPSIRDSIRRTGDELLPGLGEIIVSGGLNRLIPYDAGVRFSNGNIIPGTGIGLAGADVSRELISIGGPMASWIQQMVGTAGNVANILPGGKAFSLESTLRKSPVAFVRAVSDAFAFDKHGAIVDKRGYVVSEDYNAAIGLGRILGLQPSATSAMYGAIREAKLITEYQKSMSVYYRDRIVAATVAGDNAKVQALYAEAREWNESAEGTGLEVVNLRSRVRSALRSQRLGASERFLKTTPLSSRSAAQKIVDAYIAE